MNSIYLSQKRLVNAAVSPIKVLDLRGPTVANDLVQNQINKTILYN